MDSRTATRVIGPREEEGQALEGEEGGPCPARAVFSFVFSFVSFLCHPSSFLCLAELGGRRLGCPSMTRSGLGQDLAM